MALCVQCINQIASIYIYYVYHHLLKNLKRQSVGILASASHFLFKKRQLIFFSLWIITPEEDSRMNRPKPYHQQNNVFICLKKSWNFNKFSPNNKQIHHEVFCLFHNSVLNSSKYPYLYLWVCLFVTVTQKKWYIIA